MNKETKKRRLKWIILALLALVVVVIGILYFTKETTPPTPVRSSELLPDAKDATDAEVAEKAQELADANYFTLQITPHAVFETGSSEGKLEIANPSTNVYPISVEIRLADTAEVVYQSGAIQPNQFISRAKLDKVLDKGEYDAVARISIYDSESELRQGMTESQLKISIDN